MCSIVGLQGKFKGETLLKLLKDSKNRGPDSSGLFLDDKIFLNIDLDKFIDKDYHSIALGHNLLSIFNLGDISTNYQPVASDNLTLVFNGEIYNFSDVLNKLAVEEDILTDSMLILKLIESFYSNDLAESVKKTINILDGDYSFAVYDGENLAIARDPLGVKPLFFVETPEFNVFSSSKSSLKEFGEIKTLKPGHILYNWQIIPPEENIFQKKLAICENDLEGLLKSSVAKRVQYLDEIAVIFSGGVDSALLTLILKEISRKRPLKIVLYAVGKESSKDVIAARKLAKFFNLELKVCDVTFDVVKDNLERVVKLIGENNLMKIGVGMTIYLASKMIHEDGFKVAISGQGADELFAGYNRYLKSPDLDKELRHDLENMYHVNLERDDAVSMDNSVELRLPFLDKKLVEFALNIPIANKIKDSEDKLRKNILRNLAFELGLPEEFAYRPKKAAQYGTGIDKILRKKVLREVDIDLML